MSTDWNQKLAWILRDLPDTTSDLLQLSAHRSNLLGGTDVEIDVGPRADWLVASADRVPFPKGKAGERVQVDWGEHPEVTHAVAKQRYACDAIDLEAARKIAGELLEEAAKRFDRDARRMSLWTWRYLSERLAAAKGGPGPVAAQIPADPKLPNLTVWQRIGFDAALAGAFPSPSFLVIQVLPAEKALEETTTLQDLWTESSVDGELVWQAMLPIVEALGPEAILSPSMCGHPQVDAWLAAQGITSADGVTSPGASASVAGSLPSVFVALVPSDRARELGEACKKSFEDAWNKMVVKVRDHLVKSGWADPGDEAWTSIWSRQSGRSSEISWTAVGWGEDSTGAGSLLPKQEVTLLEKWARVQEDAAGLDEPWPGIYYGLWYGAALSAAAARRHMGTMSVLCEPNPPCTGCGHREALHGGSGDVDADGLAAFWKPIAGDSGKAGGSIRNGEALCSVCTLRRMGAASGLVSVPEGLAKAIGDAGRYALVLFELDDTDALLRGGKDLKQAATLADGVHSELEKSFTKRARSHIKEILDTPAPLGPARQMGVQDAQRDFLSSTVPAVLEQFGSYAAHASPRELTIIAPVDKAYALVHALRDRSREAFIELPTTSGKRLGTHIGPQTTSSALIAIVPGDEMVGPLVHDCRMALDDLARDALGGDALVVIRRAPRVEERIYAAHWDELTTSVDVLLSAVPDPEDRGRLAVALVSVAPALSNADLDKPSSAARPALVTNVLQEAGLTGADDEATDGEAVARAVCQLVDHCVRLPHGAEESHALDGVRVATSLRGVDR